MWINITELPDGFSLAFRRSSVRTQTGVIERVIVAMMVSHGIRRMVPYSELMEAAKNIQEDQVCFTMRIREGTLMLFAQGEHREPRKDIKQDQPRRINSSGLPRGAPKAYPRRHSTDESKDRSGN